MTNTIAAEIECWFKDHADGEFTQSPYDLPFIANDLAPHSDTVLYSTKPAGAQQLVRRCVPTGQPAVVGKYGLPCETELTRLRDFVGDRRLCFLGDCDPPDLLVFAWLRSYTDISHIGVSDVLLETLGVTVDRNLTIQFSESEVRGVAPLETLFLDYRSVVGPKCAALIEGTRKLEVEALISLRELNTFKMADVCPK